MRAGVAVADAEDDLGPEAAEQVTQFRADGRDFDRLRGERASRPVAVAVSRRPSPRPLLDKEVRPHAEVRAGMAMQRVLLAATAEGPATSFLSQPFETERTRASLDRLFAAAGQPHTLLRIGYGCPARLTARR